MAPEDSEETVKEQKEFKVNFFIFSLCSGDLRLFSFLCEKNKIPLFPVWIPHAKITSPDR
jgi:hypothetical protein